MPPKRARKAKGPAPSPKQRPSRAASKSAKASSSNLNEHDILESFSLFVLPRDDMNEAEFEQAEEEDPDGDDEYIRVLDVRRALSALNLPKPPADFFEEDQKLVSRRDFLELAKTMREMGGDEDEDMADENEDARPSREVDHAFALFTTPIPATGRVDVDEVSAREKRITLADLKRVAREIREDVDDKVLRMMIEEANGEEGNTGIAKGVSREEFEAVMKRAGVFA